MKSEDIIKALELAGQAVGLVTQDITVVGLAMVAIKGIFSVVTGQTLDASEYANAMRTGLARNKQWGEDRISQLDAVIG